MPYASLCDDDSDNLTLISCEQQSSQYVLYALIRWQVFLYLFKRKVKRCTNLGDRCVTGHQIMLLSRENSFDR